MVASTDAIGDSPFFTRQHNTDVTSGYRFCVSPNLKSSMRRRGSSWDNAVTESFFGSFKNERENANL